MAKLTFSQKQRRQTYITHPQARLSVEHHEFTSGGETVDGLKQAQNAIFCNIKSSPCVETEHRFVSPFPSRTGVVISGMFCTRACARGDREETTIATLSQGTPVMMR